MADAKNRIIINKKCSKNKSILKFIVYLQIEKSELDVQVKVVEEQDFYIIKELVESLDMIYDK